MPIVIKKIPKNFTPKQFIQQEEFLQKYPKCDGRGLLIAILDTGIDVSLDGLQKTSTGLPKIIDCFDFCDSGNVDTSMIRKIGKENILILLRGKEVKIPHSWKNPLNEWHLGIKSLKNIIDPEMLSEIDEQKENPEKEKPLKEEKQKTLEKFIQIMHKNNDIDCIVWNDGKKWCACIISGSTENLKNAKILTNFRDEHEYCFISDKISCCVTIKNDGNLLQLFIPYDCEHGSYVAQVAAAHYPDQSEKDGLAPGAQIVSMNIFNEHEDTKYGAVEKAFNKCIEMGVNIINISVSNKEFNKSSIINLFIKKMVNKHGIIIVQSEGNSGPFISSMRNDTNNSNDEIFTIGSVFTGC